MKKLIFALAILAIAASVCTTASARGRGSTSSSTRTEHSESKKDFTGQVTAVNATKRQVVVKDQVFNVSSSTEITINGQKAKLEGIKVGDEAKVRYTVHTNTTIRTTSGGGGRGKSSSASSSSKSTNTGDKDKAIIADSVSITRQEGGK